MRYWISPFALTKADLDLLAQTNLQQLKLGEAYPPSPDCLVLYDCPHQVLANSCHSHGRAITTPEQLLEGYSKVLEWSSQTPQPMLAMWRVHQLGPSGLGRWFEDSGGISQPHLQTPSIKPLVAAATLALLEASPQLLESYQDIELKAELFGGDPDLHYRQRLRVASLEGEILLKELHAAHEVPDQLEVLKGELNDARKETELTLLQLQQVQEELETIFIADQEKQQLLDTKTKELETSSEVCNGLTQQLEVLKGELNDAREEAELTLLQLQQVQEELENYFLRSQSCDALAVDQQVQIQRAQKLLARLAPPFANLEPRFTITPVEVLPEALSPSATTLQTEALLSAYAHSLSRAKALLQRSPNR